MTSSPALASAAHVVDFDLLTSTAGWVLTTHALLITTDRGQHWSDITPSHVGIAAGESEDGVKGVAFQDPRDGWVAIARSTSAPYAATVTLLHTGDAGRHWEARGSVTVPLQYCLCGATIDAVGDTVFMDIDVGTKADGWGRMLLERSSDGGRTWRRVSMPTSGQVAFIDAQHGVVAGGSPSIFENTPGGARPVPAPYWVTSDGGVHWIPSTFVGKPPPLPPRDATDPYSAYEIQHGLAIAYEQSAVTRSVVYVYSGHQGTDWSLVRTIPAGGLPTFDVVSPRDWLLSDVGGDLQQPRLRETDDVGATWRWLTPVPDVDPGNTSLDFSFADPDDGWAYASSSFCLTGKTDCGSSQQLYATYDGGITWTKLVLPGMT